jgi:calcineurin-like phosphoesterase family protein
MKIVVEKGQKLYFTSDTHYNHANICMATSNWPDPNRCRDFNSLYHMNAVLIDSINDTVRENDILIHMGDWSFGGFDSIIEFRKQLNCKNIYLILGNHDHHIMNNKDEVQGYFVKVANYAFTTIVVQPTEKGEANVKHRFVMCHFPIASWHDMGQGVMHVHGHIHTPHEFKVGPGKMMDVGIDGNPDFRPYSLEEVLTLIKDRPVKSLLNHIYDHHKEEQHV